MQLLPVMGLHALSEQFPDELFYLLSLRDKSLFVG